MVGIGISLLTSVIKNLKPVVNIVFRIGQ